MWHHGITLHLHFDTFTRAPEVAWIRFCPRCVWFFQDSVSSTDHIESGYLNQTSASFICGYKFKMDRMFGNETSAWTVLEHHSGPTFLARWWRRWDTADETNMKDTCHKYRRNQVNTRTTISKSNHKCSRPWPPCSQTSMAVLCLTFCFFCTRGATSELWPVLSGGWHRAQFQKIIWMAQLH